MKLTVYYDGQFWVGVFEEACDEKLRACRFVFGPEPADAEIQELVNHRMLRLMDGIRAQVDIKPVLERRINPKRLARLAARELERQGVSTYAQTAINLERESRKLERKVTSREERDALKDKKRQLTVAKAKAKHRGH